MFLQVRFFISFEFSVHLHYTEPQWRHLLRTTSV